MTLNEAIEKMTELTGQNLKLLQDINKSFTSDKSHIVTQIGGVDFYVPSFIHLENKINHLQWAFENLVKSPQHGEAWFNFDGNSRSIEVRGYQQAPARIQHQAVEIFDTVPFNGFRDLLTPRPVIRFDMGDLPNDVRRVNVRKVVFYTTPPDVDSTKASKVVSYKKVIDWISLPDSNNRYHMYDTVMELPFKQSAGYGSYIISKVIGETLEPEQVVEIRLQNDLTYINSNYNEVSLEVGDKLTTWDGSCRMEIVGLDRSDNTLNLRVQSGEYTNFIEHKEGEVSDYSRLRFLEPVNFNSDKYLNIPLEEDRYVYISISPINDRLGTHSLWSDGLMLDTSRLTTDRGLNFKRYYDKNVKNIGDIFQELIAIAPSAITKFSPIDYKSIVETPLAVDNIHYSVHHTNKHLTSSENVAKLADLNKKSKDLRTQIAGESNEDTLKTLETQLQSVEDQILAIIKNPGLPVDTPEYHILAWVDLLKSFPKTDTALNLSDISHIEYKYARKAVGSEKVEPIETILPRPYTHNTWTYGSCKPNEIDISYDAGQYTVDFRDINPNENEAKNNGLSIPIRPGEVVVWQCRLVWRFGQPYTHVRGSWSDPMETPFPGELMPTLNPLQLVEDSITELVAHQVIKLLGAKEANFNRLVDEANTAIRKALTGLESTKQDYDALILDINKEMKTLGDKAREVEERVNSLYDDLYIPPVIKVNGVSIHPGETHKLDTTATYKMPITITIESPKVGKPIYLFAHTQVGAMIIDGQQQVESGLIWMDRVYGKALLGEVKFMPQPLSMPRTQQTIQYIKSNAPISIDIPYDTGLGRGEIAFSIKYDPVREPLIYIINLHVSRQ